MRARIAMGLAALAVGCGVEAEAPGTAAGTLTFSTGDWEVAAGTEVTRCLYTMLPSDDDFYVVGYRAEMLAGSHHFNMFFTEPTNPAVAGKPLDTLTTCDSGFKFYLAGSQWTEIDQTIPNGLAVRIPGGSMIVLESHYVNVTDAPRPARVDVELEGADPADVDELLGLYFNVMDDIRIEPGASVRLQGRCPADEGANLVLLTSHMHQFGRSFEINLWDRATETRTPLYLSEDYAHPETAELWQQPVVVGPDQELEWACNYENPGTAPVTGGGSAETDEMCIMAAYYWPLTREQPYCVANAKPTEVP